MPLTTRVIAVSSGKGGVGKSSVTVNLATALARRGLTVGILDADIWGFSVPRMLGVAVLRGDEDGKIHPNTLDVPAAGDDPGGTLKVVSMGFLVEQEETALMWRGLMLTKAVEQFLTDVRWGAMDYLLIDMPPGTGPLLITAPSLSMNDLSCHFVGDHESNPRALDQPVAQERCNEPPKGLREPRTATR